MPYIESQQLLGRYQDLQRYVGWSGEDAQRVAVARPFVAPMFPDLIDDFYAEIERHPQARQVITGGAAQVERLKGTLRQWIAELFSGQYDEAYVRRRWQVGCRHVEIGLDQVYTNAALSRLRRGITLAMRSHWTGSPEELFSTIASLNLLLDLDLAIIEDAYQSEYLRRREQAERLAAIGQVAGGVVHELRNPLNVVKTSVYYLRTAKQGSPEKVSLHLERIDRHVGLADGVITALSDFARLPVPVMQPFALQPFVQELLENCALPENIAVGVSCPDGLPRVLGDIRQLAIVFSNLVRNARDAMPEGGTLSIAARQTGSDVDVSVQDTGTGIAPEQMKRILEPLYSTKVKGIGLGLAITRAILDKHGAELRISSQLGAGSTFVVQLAAAREAGE